MDLLAHKPGLWFVIATLLPLASFLFLLIVGGVRNYLRKTQPEIYGVPERWPAYVATAAIGLAFVCASIGFVQRIADHGHAAHHHHDHEHGEAEHAEPKGEFGDPWAGSVEWASISSAANRPDRARASFLRVGFYIDNLSAIMFVMVTFIATLIHLFSMGYMSEELQKTVEDHEVHTDHGHLHRRGRFGRFFLFLSLFCFSMLNLILADNLFQVFVSWELVGVCSFLLIGFYYERQSASNAANKAFITNRVGDAGFIIGVLILWTYVGTLNFQEIFQRVRAPERINDKAVPLGGQIVRADEVKVNADGSKQLKIKNEGEAGQYAIVFPKHADHTKFPGAGAEVKGVVQPGSHGYSYLPTWMLIAAGLGIFLGCVGKSAQFPLHVWLPDAMEGPTPVSALIHAATMVAAGVYLVGRCAPLFTSEVNLTIAYTGGITLFVAASIAVVMNDIKKVLAYSTVSQLGFMMLALGVGGWVAGLMHLVTHAFFKALLFLCSGSVIYGCHHQQDMRKMGGLYPKMKITALTMLVGVLAIAGTPFFSGWYSKDAVLANAFGFFMVYKHHFLLFLLPVFTAGITTFYMFRMWFMTFTGEPKDHHVYEHAHESPRLMTVPLVLLAFFSVVVAWGWPLWDAHASWLGHQIHHAQPTSIKADFGGVVEEDGLSNGPEYKPLEATPRGQAHLNHLMVGYVVLGIAIVGFVFAWLLYYSRQMNPAESQEAFGGVYKFLEHKWYFDELYSVALVRPALIVGQWARWFDTHVIDGIVHLTSWIAMLFSKLHGLIDRYVVDGLVNFTANVLHGFGTRLRGVQTGYLRSYVLFLALAALGLWALLSSVIGAPK